jgi:hypothetical protein
MAPQLVAMTGVPQASASMATRPNGSGQRMGFDQGPSTAEELDLGLVVDFADVVDAVAEARFDDVRVVVPLGWFLHLGRDLQLDTGAAGDGDGPVDALVGVEAAHAGEVLVPARAEWVLVEIEAVAERQELEERLAREAEEAEGVTEHPHRRRGQRFPGIVERQSRGAEG